MPPTSVPDHGRASDLWSAGRDLPLDEAVSQAMAAKIVVAPVDPSGGLSPREIEVLRLLAQGKTDGEVAAALFISRRTASSHVRHIYEELGVSSRAAATAYAIRHGLA